jgi:hypothetical protein
MTDLEKLRALVSRVHSARCTCGWGGMPFSAHSHVCEFYQLYVEAKGLDPKYENSEPNLSVLRELRKWHWKEVVRNREHFARFERIGPESRARMHDKIAGFHLRAVQSLSDLFPVGDTAEIDYEENREITL